MQSEPIFFDSETIEAADTRSLFQAFDTKGRPLLAGDLKNTIYLGPDRQSPHGSLIDFIVGSFDTFELNATATAARRSGAAERFKSFIDQAKMEYDLIVIDTNPSATFVTMQALANANFLVAPINFDAFSLQGIHLVVKHLKDTFSWLDNPTRLCLVANKVPRSPSDGELRRLEREENKIKERYPRLARSIKLERIHRSDLIANRAVAKGFLADHNGVAGGFYDTVVKDFIAVAKAVELDLNYAFDTSRTQKSSTSSGTGWGRTGLASLLKELRALNDKEFKAALEEAAGPAAPQAKKKSTKAVKPRKDSPVARVAKVLREARGLADHDAQLWLRSALQRDGVDPARIPAVSDGPLEAWLEILFETVRSADALAVAQSGSVT